MPPRRRDQAPTRPAPRPRLAIGAALAAAAACLLAATGRAEAQLGAASNVAFSPYQSGLRQPYFPPAGGWGQVLTVTDKWVVLQNEQGQQFPVSFDSVNLFVMRWPTDPTRIGANDYVEVTGLDLGTNRVQADHVDIFQGSAKNLVTPTYQPIIGFNRVVTPFDLEQQRTFGINLHYLLMPGEERMPPRLHVVGPAVNQFPIQIGVGGNNGVTVLPAANGMTMTQVTPGVPSYVRPGDAVYVVPIPARATPRSLALSELVVYKTAPIEQFAR